MGSCKSYRQYAGFSIRSICSIILFCLFAFDTYGQVYFNAKIAGPSANLFSINENNLIDKITNDGIWRDKEFSVSDAGDIVFSSNRKDTHKMDLKKSRDDFNIFLMDSSNKELTQITFKEQREFSPKFDPSGGKIAYLMIAGKGLTELHLYDIKKKRNTILIAGKEIYDFNWSPDGEQIAYSSSDKKIASVSLVNVDTGLSKPIVVSRLSSKGYDQRVTGDLLASSFSNMYLISPTWSPNGDKIAFITHPIERNQTKFLYLITIDGGNLKRLSAKGQQVQSPVNWHHSSNKLVYSALVNYQFYYDETLRDKVYKGAMQVFDSDLNGKSTQLTYGDHFHGRPTYSPDGKNVAYLFSNKLGGSLTYSLKTMSVDGTGDKEIYSRVDKESMLYWR